MSHQTTLRPGDVTVTITVTAPNGVTAAKQTVLTAKELAAGDPSRLIQMAADLGYVKCQQLVNEPELAIAPSPEKVERDLRSEFELNRKAAKVAGVVLKFSDNALMGSFVCHRVDGKEWNPINDRKDCVHMMHMGALCYEADAGGNLLIYFRNSDRVLARGGPGGFTNPSNRQLAVETAVQWYENRKREFF